MCFFKHRQEEEGVNLKLLLELVLHMYRNKEFSNIKVALYLLYYYPHYRIQL